MMNKVLKDSSWNTIDYLSSILVFLISAKILLEQIGIDGYGFYTFFSSIVGTFGLIDLGMGMAVAKYLSEYLSQKKYNEANQVIAMAFAFYLFVGSLLFALVFFYNANIIAFLELKGNFSELGSSILIITSLIFIVNMLSSIMINTLVALEEWKTISFISIFSKVLNTIVLVYILTRDILVEDKIYFIFYLLLATSIVKGLIYFAYVKQLYTGLGFSKPTSIVKDKVLSFLKISSFQYLLSTITMHLDNIVVTKYFGLESMGVYVFVRNSFFYLYGFLANIFKIYLPKLSKLHGNCDYEGLKKSFVQLLKYSFVVSLGLALASVLIWEPLIRVYLNQEFASKSIVYMEFFAILLIVRSQEPIFSYFFNAIAKPSVLVVNLIIGATATITGYYLLVPVYGIYGLIVSQSVSCIFVYSYNFYAIRRKGFTEFCKSM